MIILIIFAVYIFISIFLGPILLLQGHILAGLGVLVPLLITLVLFGLLALESNIYVRIKEARRDVPALINYFDRGPMTIVPAAGALGRLGDLRAVKPLVPLLKDDDGSVRKAANRALHLIRTKTGNPINILVAFLIQGPAGGLPFAQRSVIMVASQSEWEQKIRMEAHCPGAEVLIVQPDEWKPPALREVSQLDLTENYSTIKKCIQAYVTEKALKLDQQELAGGGTLVLNPVSGKAFFIYKY